MGFMHAVTVQYGNLQVEGPELRAVVVGMGIRRTLRVIGAWRRSSIYSGTSCACLSQFADPLRQP
jgi:hypothetical protein